MSDAEREYEPHPQDGPRLFAPPVVNGAGDGEGPTTSTLPNAGERLRDLVAAFGRC